MDKGEQDRLNEWLAQQETSEIVQDAELMETLREGTEALQRGETTSLDEARQSLEEMDAADMKHISAIWKMPHSERFRHLLLAQYFTFRSMYQSPDVAWRFLGLYKETWMSEPEHVLDEIAWLSQEMGDYD